MRKLNTVVTFSVGFLMVIFLLGFGGARADNEAMANNSNQVLNDEGYGNDDAEYYNSPDDMTNDDEPSGPQENENAQ